MTQNNTAPEAPTTAQQASDLLKKAIDTVLEKVIPMAEHLDDTKTGLSYEDSHTVVVIVSKLIAALNAGNDVIVDLDKELAHQDKIVALLTDTVTRQMAEIEKLKADA
jgi:hypothetical protein